MTSVFLLVLLALTPTLHIEATCRGEEKRLPADQQSVAYKSCLQDEQDARKALDAKWTQIPVVDRTNCTELGRMFESYVELKVCIEIRASSAFAPKP